MANRNRTAKPARDAHGRFTRAKPALPPPSPMWLPDARWVAPSAADRELARAVVAAADARRAADEKSVVDARRLAEYVSRSAILDNEREPRDWIGRIGTALILAIVMVPLAVGCGYLVRHKTAAPLSQPAPTVQMPEVDAISGGRM
jgi:hypothetical protein